MNKPHDNCHTNILSAKLPLRIHWQLSATLHPASTSAGCGRRGVLRRDATKEHVFYIGCRVAITVGDGRHTCQGICRVPIWGTRQSLVSPCALIHRAFSSGHTAIPFFVVCPRFCTRRSSWHTVNYGIPVVEGSLRDCACLPCARGTRQRPVYTRQSVCRV